MRSWQYGLLFLGLLLASVNAGEVLLVSPHYNAEYSMTDIINLQNQNEDTRQKCAGMYSRKSWGGNVDPFILVKFMKPVDPKEATVSLLIFEWNDEELIGRYPEPDAAMVRKSIVWRLTFCC